ncbi:hypothetical protein EVAR_98337_1 [Eumeta japonica]|uniref:Uncharacterized protein n=1 Tax=Eumeta variegata TaxID=151549 RepID=A0A4C1XBH2_EUMVA|nr:hypothetical protein EVAR_98337_1 [Eumeta japonica]
MEIVGTSRSPPAAEHRQQRRHLVRRVGARGSINASNASLEPQVLKLPHDGVYWKMQAVAAGGGWRGGG